MSESFLKGNPGKLLYLKKFPPEDFQIKRPLPRTPNSLKIMGSGSLPRDFFTCETHPTYGTCQ